MIYGWEEFTKWSENKGLDVDDDVVIFTKRSKTVKHRFVFWSDGSINVTSEIAGIGTRITIAENRETEDMKKIIEALM